MDLHPYIAFTGHSFQRVPCYIMQDHYLSFYISLAMFDYEYMLIVEYKYLHFKL